VRPRSLRARSISVRTLDALIRCADALAAVALVALCALVLAGIAGRALGLTLPGLDAYAGYCLAACGFLALAGSLRHGDHIRTEVLVARLPERWQPAVDRGVRLLAAVLGICLASALVRMAWLSAQFGDLSQGIDATPLWLPQSVLALGAVIFALALVAAVFDRGEV
jgi:TRAP-type C4-dicarboxylate transport system permease small subunit